MNKPEIYTEETSFQLFQIIEDRAFFKPLKKVNGMPGQYLQFEQFEDSEDGTFLRVSDFTRLVNKMDTDGVSAYLNWISPKNNLKIVLDGCQVIRESKWDSEATINFNEPIKVIFGYIGTEPIVKEVNQIKGQFTFEWFWTNNGRQNKIANGAEIYFECSEYNLI